MFERPGLACSKRPWGKGREQAPKILHARGGPPRHVNVAESSSQNDYRLGLFFGYMDSYGGVNYPLHSARRDPIFFVVTPHSVVEESKKNGFPTQFSSATWCHYPFYNGGSREFAPDSYPGLND